MELTQSLRQVQQRIGIYAERWQLLRFWRWWMRELTPVIPARLREWYAQRRRLTAVELTERECVIHAQTAEGWVERARIDLSAHKPSEHGPLIRAELARLRPGQNVASRVALLLSAAQCLRKTIELPQAVEENLRTTLAFEMDRYTPFAVEQVYFDCAISTRDYAANKIGVALAVAPRPAIDGPCQLLESAGVRVIAAWPALGEANPLDLLPTALRPERTFAPNWQSLTPPAIVAALCAIAIILPIWQKRAQLIALQPLLSRAQQQAEIADGLRRKLDTMVADYNYLADKKRTNPAALQVLDEVTRLLPDDTWVQTFELKTDAKTPAKPRELQIQGETNSSGKMIGLLEGSKYLTQAAWKSPLVTGQPGVGERFHLAAFVKPISALERQLASPPPGAAAAPVPAAQSASPPPSAAGSATAPASPATPPGNAVAKPAPAVPPGGLEGAKR
jgi:general secretion pathway protein L